MNTPHPATVPIAPALADLAFASATDSQVSRSLAWSSPGDLGIDLNDPTQRRFGDYELLELIKPKTWTPIKTWTPTKPGHP